MFPKTGRKLPLDRVDSHVYALATGHGQIVAGQVTQQSITQVHRAPNPVRGHQFSERDARVRPQVRADQQFGGRGSVDPL